MDTELLMQSYQVLIYDEIADYEQTIAGLSAHLQADPTNSHAFNNRAVAHWEIGRIAEAWVEWDCLSGLIQLGHLAPPSPSAAVAQL